MPTYKQRISNKYIMATLNRRKNNDAYYLKMFMMNEKKLRYYGIDICDEFAFSEYYISKNIDTENKELASIFYTNTKSKDNKVYLRLKWGFNNETT